MRRYEVAIAATFVRKGFRITWTTDKTKRAPDFTATHPETGEVLAVETKSRHRPGALDRPGSRDASPERADVERLLLDAVKQAPGDKPYAIFIDANLPPKSGGPALDQRLLEGLSNGLPSAVPAEVTLVAVTNFGWHYEGPRTVHQRSTFVLHRSPTTRFPMKDEPSFFALLQSLDSYGQVPLDERDPDNDV